MPKFSLVFLLILFTLLQAVGGPEAGLVQLEQMLKVLEKTESELSTWRAESLLSRLNRHPVDQAWHADHEFCDLFKQIPKKPLLGLLNKPFFQLLIT